MHCQTKFSVSSQSQGLAPGKDREQLDKNQKQKDQEQETSI